MTNYIGAKCPVCNKRFATGDDIVVCPACGAPHHRACYQERGECAFAAEHMSGKEWHNPEEPEGAQGDEGPAQGVRQCPGCGSANPEQSIFCQVCGAHMSSSQPGGQPHIMQDIFVFSQADPWGGVDKNETIEDVSVQDLARYVGPNSAHYIPRFYRISKEGAGERLNLSALFMGFFYYFYRKMYLVGAALLTVFAACSIPFFLTARELLPEVMRMYGIATSQAVNLEALTRYQNITSVTMLIYLAVSAAVSLFANRLYLKQALGKIRELQGSGGKVELGAYNPQLSLQAVGGVDRRSVILLVCTLVVGSNVIMSVLSTGFLN